MEPVTISEAARRLGVSRKTVHRRIDAGELVTVETPDGRRVVMPDAPAAHTPHTPAHVPARDGAQATDSSLRPDSVQDDSADHGFHADSTVADARVGIPDPQVADLRARLERAEQRIDQLLDITQEQNQTIQAQTIRLAQLEGRMLDAPAQDTPEDAPAEAAQEPQDEPEASTADIPVRPRRWSLRGLYALWRGVR